VISKILKLSLQLEVEVTTIPSRNHKLKLGLWLEVGVEFCPNFSFPSRGISNFKIEVEVTRIVSAVLDAQNQSPD